MSILGWFALVCTFLMCLHFAWAWFDLNKPPLNRRAYLKTAAALAVQCCWALFVPSFNKIHLLWLYWLTMTSISHLEAKWAAAMFLSQFRPTAPPLPPLLTTLAVVGTILYLLS